jgi:hypothetical protein
MMTGVQFTVAGSAGVPSPQLIVAVGQVRLLPVARTPEVAVPAVPLSWRPVVKVWSLPAVPSALVAPIR